MKRSLLFLLLMALFMPWAAQAQTLFSEGFEGGSMPTGWTQDGPNTWSVGSGDYSTSTGAGLGTYNALITHVARNNVTKLITPAIDLSSVTSATLSFMHVQRSWAGDIDYLKVYYRTSTSGTWTQLVEYTGAVASWTTEEDIVLPNTTATYQLAFEHTDNYGYGVGLDQVVISAPSDCPKPTLGPAEYVSEEGVSFQWTENGSATQWQLQYSTSADFSNPTTIDRNGIPALAVTGLSSGTTYYFHVRSYCGNGEFSDWSNVVSFSTLCDAFNLPYTYGFEDPADLNCWNVVYTANTPGINNGSAHQGTNSFRFSSYSSASSYDQYLISPQFNSTNGVGVSFYYAAYNTSTETFKVGYSTTSNDPSAFTWGDEISVSGTTWNLYEGSFPAGTKYVGVYYYSNYQYYLYVDDFTFEVPSDCRKPTSLAATEVGPRTAKLSWTENGEATAWNLLVNDQPIENVTNPYTLTGLTPETRYTVQVSPVCEVEKWSDAITFTTTELCPKPTNVAVSDITPVSANVSWTGTASSYNLRYRTARGFHYGFETATPWVEDNFAPCTTYDGDGLTTYQITDWEPLGTYQFVGSMITLQSGVVVFETGVDAAHSGNLFGGFVNGIPTEDVENNNDFLITPSITIENGDVFEFWAASLLPNWGLERMKVGVYGGNGTISQYFEGSATDYVEVPVAWTKYSYDLSAFAGQSIQLAINCVSSDAYVLGIDDIFVGNPNNDTWDLTVNDVTSPYALTGLSAETMYEVQVQAACGEDGESAWVSTTFTTPSNCEAPTALNVTNLMPTTATLNWTGYQDGFEVRYRPVAQGSELEAESFEGSLNGWTTIDADGDSYNWDLASVIMAGYNIPSHEGEDCVTSQSYAGSPLTPDNYLVSPQVELGGSITFWACAQDASYPAEHFGVAVSTTSNTDASAFTTIQEWTMTAKKSAGLSKSIYDNGNYQVKKRGNRASGNWYQYTVDLKEYAGQTGYVAIRHFDCTDMFYLNVDDVIIYSPNTGGEEEQEWIMASTDATSLDIEDLSPETTYEWQVRGENRSCTNGEDEGFTAWSEMGNFTTPGDCDLPIDLVAEAEATSATLSWTGYQESFNLQYREAMQIDLFFYEDFSGESIAFTTSNFGADNNDFGNASGWYGFTDGTSAIIFFPDTELTSPQYLISYEMEPTISGTTIEFGAAASGTGCVYRLGFSSTDNSISSFTWSDDIAIENSYVEYEVPVGTKYFAIAYPETNPSDAYAYVIDFMVYANYVPAGEWITVENTTSPVTIEGLTPETEYDWQVQGVCSEGTTNWVGGNFTTPEQTNLTQTIQLTAGVNWVSFYVETTLDDVKAALQSTGGTNIIIKAKDSYTTWNGRRWVGTLSGFDVNQMFMVTVQEDCEIALEGMLLNPADHPITISEGANWIGFPFNEDMTIANAFAGFPANQDLVKGQNSYTTWNGRRWVGSLTTLEPGKGYIYTSNASEDKTFVFPTNSSKATQNKSFNNSLIIKKAHESLNKDLKQLRLIKK